MENKESSSGYLEDLVRGFTQLAALELHAKTAFEKAQHQLTIVEVEEIESALITLQKADNHLKKITELRRQSMRVLLSKAEKANLEKWCEVKHSAMAAYTMFEVYQAAPFSNEIEGLYIDTNNLFIEVMSDFLGLNIEPCAACFSDALKSNNNEEE